MIHRTDWCNIYRFETPNTGDTHSSPCLYFKMQRMNRLDILKSEFLPKTNALIGGGGILHFGQKVEKIIKKCKQNNYKTILWGVGHNQHHSSVLKFPSWLKECDLIGVRDWGTPYEWVPCASCMHPIFDQKFDLKREIGFYSHHAINNSYIQGMKNNRPMEEIINYLGSSETIVTNSYHGVYWGMLLNRKVIAYPHSTKFFGFKYHVILLESHQNWSDYVLKPNKYDGFLEECRIQNRTFYEKVCSLIS